MHCSSRNCRLAISGLALCLALSSLAYAGPLSSPVETAPAGLQLREFFQCLQTDGCQVTAVDSFEDLLDLELSQEQQFVLLEQGKKAEDGQSDSSFAQDQGLKELEPFKFGYEKKRKRKRREGAV